MVSNIKFLFTILSGPKSRVPLGKVGFWLLIEAKISAKITNLIVQIWKFVNAECVFHFSNNSILATLNNITLKSL
jgi:hypothetical protein